MEFVQAQNVSLNLMPMFLFLFGVEKRNRWKRKSTQEKVLFDKQIKEEVVDNLSDLVAMY